MFFFFQAEDGIRDLVRSRGLGDVYKGQPLGRSILGTSELIAAVDREKMLAWRDRNYWASRIVVAAAGNIDHAKFAEAAAKLFGSIERGQQPQREPPSFSGTEQKAQKPLDQTHVVLSFAAPSYRDPEIYQLQVLSSILGGGMSSRLFQEVREKRGLCYSVFAFGSAYEDAGQIGVYAASSPEHTEELLDVTSSVMMSVTSAVTDAEVARAKAQL